MTFLVGRLPTYAANRLWQVVDRPTAELLGADVVNFTIGLRAFADLYVLVTVTCPVCTRVELVVVPALYNVNVVIVLGRRCRTLRIRQLFTERFV